MKYLFTISFFSFISHFTFATDYHVGPGQTYTNIGDAPWASLQAGDKVYIHWRSTAYKEKWVINAQGTVAEPIEIIGVLGNGGDKPIIDGDGAITAAGLNYWGENRGVIKIGGSNTPSDGLPSYITIENLDVRSGRPAYSFTNDNATTEVYSSNCASIYIEKGEHIIIRNCDIHDSGNGIFIGAFDGFTQDILLSGNYIYDNGIDGSFYEHNTYTAALDITYEYNRFGPLRVGALGNNLKDRSAGLVVRYNWIESGNRQLDLVDAEDTQVLVNHPSYATTYVYGNILIEPDGAGNSQIIHYGGDSGTLDDYRKGDLYFYNNTVISTRSGNTTLVRLSSADETMHAFNNVIYNTANGSNMALMNDEGTLNIENNWLQTGWVNSHSTMAGTVNDLGNNLTGTDPLFTNFGGENFTLDDNSILVEGGMPIPAIHLPIHNVLNEYLNHTADTLRYQVGTIDIGAFENTTNLGFENYIEDHLIVYPNPSNGILTIEIPGDAKYDAQLFSIDGRLIDAYILKNEINTIEIDQAVGVYILEIVSGELRETFRLIIK
jgi:hypothetical protein